MEKVTVIGGGNGAFATAADLTIRGNQVTLFELPRFAAGLSEVIEKGGIEMEAYANNGLTGGFAKLHKITVRRLQSQTLCSSWFPHIQWIRSLLCVLRICAMGRLSCLRRLTSVVHCTSIT